jgi:hypothetical protein
VTLAFPSSHALADTDLALHWTGDDTPEDLGVTFQPELDDLTPIVGQGLTWNMVCENRRNSRFEFSVRCSKLLERSPLQMLELAHNWLVLGETKQSSRFPAVGGAPLQLGIQILSAVSDVGSASDVEVVWCIDGEQRTLPTGEGGWCEYPFEPVEEGTFTVTAAATSHYDDQTVEYPFTVTVLGEEPWSQLVTVTLGGRESGSVGLVCFRDVPVDLRVELVGEAMLDEEIYLDLISDADLSFTFDPQETRCQLTRDGLSWKVNSTSEISARFQLRVHHDELEPFELPGLLLSQTLEGEGTLTFDERTLDHGSTAYPCLGAAEHKLRFTPKPDSPLNSLQVAAKWADASSNALEVRLDPEVGVEQPLVSGGVEWGLDCSASVTAGELGLSLDFNQVALTYPPVPMLLGHNRAEIADVHEASFDPEVGQSVTLWLKAKSHYTEQAVADVVVSFMHGGTSTPILTERDGWAKFDYFAIQPGEDSVIATVQSPYDEPDAFPSHTFEINVIGADAEESGTRVSTSTMQTKEG